METILPTLGLLAFGSAFLLCILNSRQWLIAMALLPFALAALAWWRFDGAWAIITYWLSISAMCLPLARAAANARHDASPDLKTMWRQPFPMWAYLMSAGDRHE